MTYILFIIGLLGLWAGADAVTKGSLGIARKLDLSETFIGMTVLALGTDLPEVTCQFQPAAWLDNSGNTRHLL